MRASAPAAASSSQPAVEQALELLAPLGAVRARRMFGGHGFYVDELFIALIANDRLYLKTDEATRARFEAAACEPFTFASPKRGKTVMITSYYSAPADALESPHAMQPWAQLAIAAALRARSRPSARARAPKVPTSDATQPAVARASKRTPARKRAGKRA